MRGTTELPVKNIFKQICPTRNTFRTVTVSAPKKHEMIDTEQEGLVAGEKVESVVAFSKPPMPPVLGPFVLFSLLEMGSSSDEDGM